MNFNTSAMSGSTARSGPMRRQEPPGGPGSKGPQPTGITGRVEAMSRARAPAPKGKGIVMIILAVAVLFALIWDLSGRGAAARKVREQIEKDAQTKGAPPPVAPKAGPRCRFVSPAG